MPRPVNAPVSLRWQLLTDALATRARWSAHCARLVRRQSKGVGLPPDALAAPVRDGSETAASRPTFAPR